MVSSFSLVVVHEKLMKKNIKIRNILGRKRTKKQIMSHGGIRKGLEIWGMKDRRNHLLRSLGGSPDVAEYILKVKYVEWGEKGERYGLKNVICFFRAFLFTLEYIVIECIGIQCETSSTLGLLKK